MEVEHLYYVQDQLPFFKHCDKYSCLSCCCNDLSFLKGLLYFIVI